MPLASRWTELYMKIDLLASADDTSAFMNCLACPYIADSGLKNVTFDSWRSPTSGTLNLDTMLQKSMNASNIALTDMTAIPESIVTQLSDFMIEIIETGTDLKVVEINNNQADTITDQTR